MYFYTALETNKEWDWNEDKKKERKCNEYTKQIDQANYNLYTKQNESTLYIREYYNKPKFKCQPESGTG